MSSPLGTYGPLVAAVVSVGVIAVFLLASVAQVSLGIPPASLQDLRELSLLALGAVLGTTAGAASSRQDIAATNRRLDAIGAPSAAEADQVTRNGGG